MSVSEEQKITAQLEKLRDLRAQGIARVKIRSPVTEREIEHRSDAEIGAAIADLEGRLRAIANPQSLKRLINARCRKGY